LLRAHRGRGRRDRIGRLDLTREIDERAGGGLGLVGAGGLPAAASAWLAPVACRIAPSNAASAVGSDSAAAANQPAAAPVSL
jgi:hypothetical protein